MAALETGQLHMSWAPFEEVRGSRRMHGSSYSAAGRASYIFLQFNTKKPPFDKFALRRAIAYSVDSKEVLDASYLYGTVIQAPLPLGVRGFSARSAASTATGRRGQGRALFKEAGFTKGADGRLRDGAGKPVRSRYHLGGPQISGRPRSSRPSSRRPGWSVS